jgi:hypothetical protein
MAGIAAKLSALPKRALEAVLLRQAEERAKSYAPEQGAHVRSLWQGAVRRMRAARDLRDASNVAAAGTLYREAGVLAARAIVTAQDAGANAVDDAAAWNRVRELAELGNLPKTSIAAFADGEPLDEARDLAEAADPLLVDALPPAVARERLDRVDKALLLLLAGVEPRTTKELRRSRVLRIAALALVFVGVLVGLVAWIVAPANVALGKPTMASSYWAGSPTADALVNGSEDSPWGAATGTTEDPWFRIDLLAPHRIDRIVIVNRQDAYASSTTPIALELSEDGVSFQEVRRFTGPGESGQRFVYRGDGKNWRFVRVRHIGRRAFALSEIEVYGPER